jgi:Holliday junction resolvasome RuvABC endonuclease subunit
MAEQLLPTYLVSIDPGLDHTGVATFALDPRIDWRRADFTQKCGALEKCELITTKPEWSMPHRLQALANELRSELAYTQPEIVVLEVPATSGQYQRVASGAAKYQRGGTDKFFQALGVISVVVVELLGLHTLHQVKASTKKKLDRQQLLRIALRRVGKEKEAAYGSDRLDAIFAGAAEPWEIEPRRIPELAR